MRGHAPPENFENLGLLECISRILGHEEGYSNRTQTSLILDSFYSTVHKNCKYFFLSSLSLLLRLKHFKKSSLCFLWCRHACNLFKSRELYVTSRACGNIHTHTRCAAFAPRTHGLENIPGCSATERSIEEIDGRRAEITETSGNILVFFFFGKKLPRSRANVSHDIKKNWGHLFSK